MSTHQQMQRSHKGPLQSAQSRLAFLSYLTQKKEVNSNYKKKSFFWDQQSLYSQNLMLRSQIKQLTEANTKAKTRILQMQQELKAKNNRNNDQNYKETVLRSMSLRNISRKSLAFVRSNQEQQGQTKQVRKVIRQLKEQIQSVKNENTELKRTMKYTRMSELQITNKEMQIQMQRLNRLTHDMKDKYYSITIEFQTLREHFRREIDAKAIAVKEKDKLKRELIHLKRQNQQLNKNRQIRLRAINPQVRQKDIKLQGISFKSYPKLQYSISALQKLQSETINFDKLIHTESELKSVPKIGSNTSIELPKKETQNQILKQAEDSQEQYEFEEQEEEENKESQLIEPNQRIIQQEKVQSKHQEKVQVHAIQETHQQIKPLNYGKQKEISQVPQQEQLYEDFMQQQFQQ